MNKTEHYQLNQWEKPDRIMMDDFNRDNANLESALSENAAAIAAEEAARLGGDAALDGKIAARAAFVPLLQIVTTQSAAQLDISLANIHFADWQLLWMDVALLGSWAGYMRPNGTNNAILYLLESGTPPTYSTGLGVYYNSKQNRTIFFPGKNGAKRISSILAGETDGGLLYRGVCSTLTFSQLSSFSFVPGQSDYHIDAGSSITLWGVR